VIHMLSIRVAWSSRSVHTVITACGCTPANTAASSMSCWEWTWCDAANKAPLAPDGSEYRLWRLAINVPELSPRIQKVSVEVGRVSELVSEWRRMREKKAKEWRAGGVNDVRLCN